MAAHSGDWYLAMDDMDGQPLDEILTSLRQQNVSPGSEDVVRWGSELADLVETIHSHGFTYGDLKPSNIIVGPDGSLNLVDFELAENRNGDPESAAVWSSGTRGYLSPQRSDGHRPTVADDVYSLGALLYLLATGAEPSCAPNPAALLRRPVELLNPAVDPTIAKLIRRCLDPDPRRRFDSAAACGHALRQAGAAPRRAVVRSAERLRDDALEPSQLLEIARQIGDFLAEGVTAHDPIPAFAWRLGPLNNVERWSTDMNVGAAGAVVALSELVVEFNDAAHRAALGQAAHWLTGATRPAGPTLAGLYVGEAGVAAAQLRAGVVLGDESLIARAKACSDAIAALPHRGPDMFNGSAGRLRFHLWMWKHFGRQEDLEYANDAARYLLPHTCSGSQNKGQQFLGYAHGVAGIADSLLDLYEVTYDAMLLDAAVCVGDWLSLLAQPALTNGEGLNWPNDVESRPTMAFWCHGAAGITRFLLHLYAVRDHEATLDMAIRAARVVSTGTRWAGATQCHGLAGNIECLIDTYQSTGDARYLTEARNIAGLLPAFALEERGRLVFVTDHDRTSPGFTHGCSGTAACLLRLARPDVRSHLLSVDGFVRAA